MSAKLLLVDDEQGLLEMLNFLLAKEGFDRVTFAGSGSEALELARNEPFDLIVLDIMLPDMDGFEICRKLREFTEVPILFLTARTTDMDKIMGLSIGADDYITKPFNPLEVLARIKVRLRRRHNAAQAEDAQAASYDFGRFQLYPTEGRLVVDQLEVPCPAKEFELLWFLCKHPNQIFETQHLYEKIWGQDSIGNENTVMVHIRRLRQKIEREPNRPQLLLNLRGLGYKLAWPPREDNRT